MLVEALDVIVTGVGVIRLAVVFVLVAVATSSIEYVRTRNWSWLIIGTVPALTLLLCGAILAATKVAP